MKTKENLEQTEEYANIDNKFPCLICGTQLETASMSSDYVNADVVVALNYGVYNGLTFSTSGNFGSRILDMGGLIHFVICDTCMLQRRHRLLGRSDTNVRERCTTDTYKQVAAKYVNGVEFFQKWIDWLKSKFNTSYYEEVIKPGEELVYT